MKSNKNVRRLRGVLHFPKTNLYEVFMILYCLGKSVCFFNFTVPLSVKIKNISFTLIDIFISLIFFVLNICVVFLTYYLKINDSDSIIINLGNKCIYVIALIIILINVPLNMFNVNRFWKSIQTLDKVDNNVNEY